MVCYIAAAQVRAKAAAPPTLFGRPAPPGPPGKRIPIWRSNPTDQQTAGPSATHAFAPPHRDSSPDWQSGPNKDLKWRVICAGVQRLCEEQGLNEEDVALWVDWQSSTPHRSSNPPD